MIKGGHINEIKWKGDTPYVDSPDIKTINEAAAPLPLTSKLIWLSDLHTGYYHDNMNGKMFMIWINTKVILLAASNYPVMQMLPVMDNAIDTLVNTALNIEYDETSTSTTMAGM